MCILSYGRRARRKHSSNVKACSITANRHVEMAGAREVAAEMPGCNPLEAS